MRERAAMRRSGSCKGPDGKDEALARARATSPARAPGCGERSSHCQRVLRASAIVVAIVVMACVVDGALSAIESVSAVADRASLIGEGASPAMEDSEVPAWFAEELFSVQGYSDVRVASGGAVVGFSANAGSADEFAALATLMEQKGWTLMESGVESGGSFLKDDGLCTWAWVSCVDVAGETSVVVQCAGKFQEV